MTAGPIARKAKEAAFILIACLSLVVSSLGACICPHHETKAEKTTLSCHSASHEVETVSPLADVDEAETPCVCVWDASPVIFNKSERKKAVDQKFPAAVVELPTLESAEYFATVVRPSSVAPEHLHTSLYSRSAPSRAPPRL